MIGVQVFLCTESYTKCSNTVINQIVAERPQRGKLALWLKSIDMLWSFQFMDIGIGVVLYSDGVIHLRSRIDGHNHNLFQDY